MCARGRSSRVFGSAVTARISNEKSLFICIKHVVVVVALCKFLLGMGRIGKGAGSCYVVAVPSVEL